MSRAYPTLEDGQPWLLRGKPAAGKLACCDCKLVHVVMLRPTKGGVEMTVWRDNRATAARRRALKK